jgi:hypothetical protein
MRNIPLEQHTVPSFLIVGIVRNPFCQPKTLSHAPVGSCSVLIHRANHRIAVGLSGIGQQRSRSTVFDTRTGKTISYLHEGHISSKGQIVLPAEFRQMDRIEPGQEFEVERLDRGDYRLVRRVAPRNEGALDWLLACPHKDFFVPIDSESTDTL